MSTFRGVVEEFPDITIDYFRTSRRTTPPLAGFLSHVHSDHLQGLDTWRSPFVYCSWATKQILLRLQKRSPLYQHQYDYSDNQHNHHNDNNHHDGIKRLHMPPSLPSGHCINEDQPRLRLKHTHKQPNYTYAHLKSILKPLPLQTPTIIELSSEKHIRVTLFDANHCVGAVCFLIEDIEGIGIAADGLDVDGNSKAIFYTGDIRAEKWWVDALIRHPNLIPYTVPPGECRKGIELDRDRCDDCSQPIKRLSTLYLDTSYATRPSHVAPYLKSDLHNPSTSVSSFPSKRTGLSELLRKVARYPPTTLFYFRAWTFGYEEVWIALAAALNTRIHVDGYWKGVYDGLRGIRSGNSGDDEIKSHGSVGVDVSRNVERKTNAHQLGANSVYYDHCTAALVGFHEGNRFHKGCLTGNRWIDNASDDDYCGGRGVEGGKPIAKTPFRVHSCQRAAPATGPAAVAVSRAVAAISTKSDYCTRSDICPVAAAVSGAQYQSDMNDAINTVNGRRRTVDGVRVVEIIPVVCRKGDGSGSNGDSKWDSDIYEVGADNDINEDVDDMSDRNGDGDAEDSKSLPSQITFPYARHSSYPEMCYLVSAFRPRSVYPCVVKIDTKDKHGASTIFGAELRDRRTNSTKKTFKGNKRNISINEQAFKNSDDERLPKGELCMRPLFGQYCSSDAKFVDDYRYDRDLMDDVNNHDGNDDKDLDIFDYGNLEEEEEEEEEEAEEMTVRTFYSEHEEETQKEHESFDSLYIDCNTQFTQPDIGIQSGEVEASHIPNLKVMDGTAGDNEGIKKKFRLIERSCEERGQAERLTNSGASKAPVLAPSLSSLPSSSSSQPIQPPVLTLNSQARAQAQAAAKKDQKGRRKINRIHKLRILSSLKISQTRRAAYEAARCTVKDGGNYADDDEYDDWSRFGGLVCAGNNHTEMEVEL